jgi:hypothetical protein
MGISVRLLGLCKSSGQEKPPSDQRSSPTAICVPGRRLAARDPSVLAVQLVREYSAGQQREQLIVRVIGRADSAELTAAARSLLDDFPQIAAEIASGEQASALVEFRDPPATLAGHWKIPLYVDERTTPEGTPCPSE